MQKYLPSKKFIKLGGIGIILAIIVFVVFFMSGEGESFNLGSLGDKKNNGLKIENQTISEIVHNDSDSDGITDWEEALWGTDKNKKITFEDTPDATYIANKKKELNIEPESIAETENLTETEKFAREFFASYSALKSSGNVDDDTINSFSNALGQKIVNPALIDSYKTEDVKINTTTDSATKQKYYMNLKNIFESYEKTGMGEELELVGSSIASHSANNSTDLSTVYEKLSDISDAYKDFAKKTMSLSVPKDLVNYHLQIANSANNTGISVGDMRKVIEDPIIGLSGLSQYQKYSDDLVKSVADLESFLLKQ